MSLMQGITVWLSFGRSFTQVWPCPNLRPSPTLTHTYLSQQVAGSTVLSEAPARYTALVTARVSRQGFLSGAPLKRTNGEVEDRELSVGRERNERLA